jgi:hypothetical protein
VIDAGSRNVKLIVASVSGEDPRSLRNERQCRARLHLGEKAFDRAMQAGRPLPDADQGELNRVAREYAALCARDGGQMLGAIATEWARRATNQDQIRRALSEQSGVTVDVIAPEDEARFGYLAATRGDPGSIVLDFGSRSFQLSFWPRGAAASEGISIPLGIDEAGERFFANPDHRGYAAARTAFLVAARPQLAPVLERLRGHVKRGALAADVVSLGENGDLRLALSGSLWDANRRRGVGEADYGSRVKALAPTRDEQRGLVISRFDAVQMRRLADAIETDAALFEELRGPRIGRIYGYKVLVFPALIAMLADEVGIDKVVLVPQEMADGLIVSRLPGGSRLPAGSRLPGSRLPANVSGR